MVQILPLQIYLDPLLPSATNALAQALGILQGGRATLVVFANGIEFGDKVGGIAELEPAVFDLVHLFLKVWWDEASTELAEESIFVRVRCEIWCRSHFALGI